jgi:hypothetical protein
LAKATNDVYGLTVSAKPIVRLRSLPINPANYQIQETNFSGVKVGLTPSTGSSFRMSVENVNSPKFNVSNGIKEMVTPKQSVTPKTISGTNIRSSSLSRTGISESSAFVEATRVGTSTGLIQNVRLAQAIKATQAQKFKVAQAKVQKVSVRPATFTPFKPITPIIATPVNIHFPKFKGKLNNLLKKKRSKSLAFDVLVRKKGKFVQIGKGLPKNLALRIGSRAVDIGELATARTFRLEASGFTNRPDIGLVNLEQFRQPLGNSRLRAPNTYIEKSKYAISSQEEKIGIPGKARMIKLSLR